MHTDGSVSTSLQAGYILHYRQWRETSFIVDAFTLAHGRISMLAKSARSSKPRVRALYQPFQPLLLSWVGAGDLRTLTGIEASGRTLSLANAELACAYYLNELLLCLLGKDQPQPVVFAHYALALSELASQQNSIEAVLRTFEVQLLDTLGILPDLARCTSDGSDVDPNTDYQFFPASAVAQPIEPPSALGFQKSKYRHGEFNVSEGSDQNRTMHPDGITADTGVEVSGATLIAMAQLDFSTPIVLEQAKRVMRLLLREQLGDRQLQSRDLFESLVRKQ